MKIIKDKIAVFLLIFYPILQLHRHTPFAIKTRSVVEKYNITPP